MSHRPENPALDHFRAIFQSVYPPTCDEREIAQRQKVPELFLPRNAMLEGLSQAVGTIKRHEGARRLLYSGERPSHYRDAEHVQQLLEAEKTRAVHIGAAACDFCPIAGTCGMGAAAVAEALRDPTTRRRFTQRVRRQGGNVQFCDRNLSPQRLVHADRAS